MNSPRPQENRKIALMLFIIVTAISLVTILMTSRRGSSASLGNSGNVKGISTEMCSLNDRQGRVIVIGDSITNSSAYMPGATKISRDGAGSDWFVPQEDPLSEMGSYYYNSVLPEIKNGGAFAVVMLGTNDCGGQEPGFLIANLDKLTRVLVENKIIPIISEIPQRSPSAPTKCLGGTNRYNEALKNFADTKGFPFREIYDELPYNTQNFSDDYHPSEQGSKVINEITEGMISELRSSCTYTPNPGNGNTNGGENEGDGGSSGSNQCVKPGGNTAWLFGSRGSMETAYSQAKQNGLKWVLAIAISAENITDNKDLICQEDIKTIVRPCLDHKGCKFWEDPKMLMDTLKSLNCEVYVTGPNEPQNELPDSIPALAEWIGPVMKTMVDNKNSNVKVLSPAFDVHNEEKPSRDLAKAVKEKMDGRWDQLDGITVNGYDVSGQKAYEMIKKFKSDISPIADGKDFYVSETGKMDGNLELLIEQYKLMDTDPDNVGIKAILFFNVFGLNPEPAFAYGKLIEEGTLHRVIGNDCTTGIEQPPLSDYQCTPSVVSKYKSIKSCEVKDTSPKNQAKGKNDNLFAGVKTEFNDQGQRYAKPIVTQKITEFNLLNWMANSSLEASSNKKMIGGTRENPFLAPCGKDKQIIFSRGNKSYDMSKVFSGTVKFTLESGGTVEYQMPALGNALACMIWRATNYDQSLPLAELESRFSTNSTVSSQSTARFRSAQSTSTAIPSTGVGRRVIAPKGTTDRCSNTVTRVNRTDSMFGPELIIYDTPIVYEIEKEYMDDVKAGRFEGDWLKIDSNNVAQTQATEDAEILGAGEALAQIWLEERKSNPWNSQYKIIHNDKAGITLTSEKKLYDGMGLIGYKEPLNTDPSCQIYTYAGDRGPTSVTSEGTGIPTGKSTGRAEYVIPWVGQTASMMKRISVIFPTFDDSNYIPSMKEKIKQLELSNTTFTDDVLIAQLESIVNDPNNLFFCADLKKLREVMDSKSFNDEKKKKAVLKYIDETDCIGREEDYDPLQQWLCENKLIDIDLCANQCVEKPTIAETTPSAELEALKGKLPWPVVASITQGYAVGSEGKHPALDIAKNPQGTPLRAIEDGRIDFIRNFDYSNATQNDPYMKKTVNYEAPYWYEYGNVVGIEHGDFYTIYAHNMYVAPGTEQYSVIGTLKEGDSVKKGQIIGYMGSTGNSTGPHSHFEIRLKFRGKICLTYADPSCTVNPTEYLSTDKTVAEYTPVDVEDKDYCEVTPPKDLNYDNLCQVLDRLEEVTGASGKIVAASLASETSAKIYIEGEDRRFYDDPYNLSYVDNNNECLRRMKNGESPCDCRGPVQLCSSTSIYPVKINENGLYKMDKNPDGSIDYEDGTCVGPNTWIAYGYSPELDMSTLKPEVVKGMCVTDGKVVSGRGRKGANYAAVIECMQGLGMDVEYGDVLDRTRLGDSICAEASSINALGMTGDSWDEEDARRFAHLWYGPAVSEDNPGLIAYQNSFAAKFNKYNDDPDGWSQCKFFNND